MNTKYTVVQLGQIKPPPKLTEEHLRPSASVSHAEQHCLAKASLVQYQLTVRRPSTYVASFLGLPAFVLKSTFSIIKSA